MQEPKYPDYSNMRAEIFRTVHVCAPCLDHINRLTFFGSPQSKPALSRWCDSIFFPHIVPAALQAHAAASSQGFRELLAIDANLDSVLVGPVARSSREAGRLMAADYHAPASERALSRYLHAIASGASSAHFVTLFAARAAIFHFSPRLTLAALLFLEMRTSDLEESWSAIDVCLNRLPIISPMLRAA